MAERVANAQEQLYGPVLDLGGGSGSRRSAELLVGVGLVAAVPVARVRGRHPAGSKLALAGNLVMAGAGLLGGHLALNRGTARRTR